MDLFTYLLAKKGHNTGRDLFSYLLGKNGGGGSGTYTTFSGISLNISNTVVGNIKNFILNSTELTQDGTPTPSNPIDVNVIKGENNVKVENKNLFKPYTNSGSVTSNGVVYTMNSDNTITINGTATRSTWVEILANFINTTSTSTTKYLNLDNTKNYILKVTVLSGTYTGTVRFYAQTNSSGVEVTIYIGNSSSITNNDGLYRAWLRVDSGASFENCKIGIQLEEGSTATEYVEHQEQNYSISLGELEYCKIGDYANQIFKNTTDSEFYDNTLIENEWYLKKKVSKIDSYNGETITTPYISTTGGLDTGATVYYGLVTPTYIHISQADYPILRSQLDNLYNNSKSYNGQTNITQENTDLPFNISVDVKVEEEAQNG